MAKQLKVTQLRGLMGSTQRQRECIKGLGLRRRHHTVVREDNPMVRGLIKKVEHMIAVEEIVEGEV